MFILVLILIVNIRGIRLYIVYFFKIKFRYQEVSFDFQLYEEFIYRYSMFIQYVYCLFIVFKDKDQCGLVYFCGLERVQFGVFNRVRF